MYQSISQTVIRIPKKDGYLKKFAEMMLNKLVHFNEGEEEGKIRCYTDVLIILSNADLSI